ncbi:MAG: 50S ribosomal protein L3 [Victivallaceae bacterium]
MHFSLMGRKKGMTHLFDDRGNLIPCTIVEVQSSFVLQVKGAEKDGYNALKMSTGEMTVKDERTAFRRVGKPLSGIFRKSDVPVCRKIYENRLASDQLDEVKFQGAVGIEIFSGIKEIIVKGVSKGKGFQGVMKRFGFRGGPASHGSGFHRHGGSNGMRSTPGRCLPGGKKPGRLGGDSVTVKNLKLIKVDLENKFLFIKGGIPGGKDAWLSVCCPYDDVKKEIIKG